MQLNLINDVTLEPQNDIVHNMWDLVSLYDRKLLIPPLHQRDSQSWDHEKRVSWIDRIKNTSLRPVGVIVTYQICDGHQSALYINDGLQRISATSQYTNNPELFGDTKEVSEIVVRAIQMPRQHRHYKNHEEALEDFQRLNFGTSLTPYEYFAGILRYIDNYESIWKPLLDEVHKTVSFQSARLIAKVTTSKPQVHKYLRSDFGLFYRFLSSDVSIARYKTASTNIKLEWVYKKSSIESKLKQELQHLSVDTATAEVKKFQALVERETSLVEALWKDVAEEPSLGKGVLPNLYRHIIDAAIWKRNTGVKTETWKNYVSALLQHTQGAASLIDPASPRDRVPLSLNDLGSVRRVCKALNLTFYDEGREKKKRNKRSNVKPGYDVSHMLPLGQSDETILEPAGINRARGANPV